MQPGDAAEPCRSGGEDGGGFLEEMDGALPRIVGEPCEQGGAGPEFHPALWIDDPQLDHAALDGWGQRREG